MTRQEMFAAAAAWLEEHDWQQGQYFNDEFWHAFGYNRDAKLLTCACFVGACAIAVNPEDPVAGLIEIRDTGMTHDEEVAGVSFNDVEGRTKAEVIARLKELANV